MLHYDLSSPTFAILLGGDLTATERLRAHLEGARVIAADGGMRHAAALGLTPELWVGDFDSASAALRQAWPAVPRESYPAAKNETDCAIAVAAALARGARSIVLAGAFGGERTDHVLSHAVHALSLAEAGTHMLLTSGEEEAFPLTAPRQVIDLPPGALFSIVGFSAVEELTIEGARYPLDRYEAAFGDTRTISNVAEGPITISFSAGRAMLFARPYDQPGA